MKIIPLGTAGFIPTNGKETACFLVLIEKTAILFDAGTGVRRIREIGRHLAGIEDLHVVFSHFHHDHTAGFTWLLRLWAGNLHFYVPSSPVIESDGLENIERLTAPPLFSLPLSKWPNFRGAARFLGEDLEIEGHKIQLLKQRHNGGSVGFRIGSFSYITDTEPRRHHISFIRGSELVFMDTMHDAADFEAMNISEANPAEHGWSRGNAQIAHLAGIGRLGLIHVDPLYDHSRCTSLLEETRQIFDASFFPQEAEVYQAE